jgi:tetratricopeptide (TPR) repeat protein
MEADIVSTDDVHPSDDFLRRFSAGTASREEARQISAHLLRRCAVCARRLQELVQPGIPEGAYDGAFARLESSARRDTGRAGSPAGPPAATLLTELDELPTLRQQFLVRNSRRYLSADLARLLAERSFELRFQDPRRMLHAARLAALIAERLQEEGAGDAAQLADLRALCASQLCSALRINGDLGSAEQEIAIARTALKEGTGDAVVRAAVSMHLGVLLCSQCHFEAAVRTFEEVTAIYRDLGKRHELANALVAQAIATLSSGDPEGSLSLLFEAIPKIEGERDPRLTLAACHAVVSSQIDAGQIEDASLKWIELRFLYEQIGDPLVRLKGQWLEGKLMIAQGVIPAGIRLLEKAREDYRRHGMPYDAAVIVLEIAQGYLHLGRRDRVRSLIAEILPVFRDLNVNANILSAFVHLRSVAQEGPLRWPAENISAGEDRSTER